jgi:hypothetical protein
VAEVYTSCGVGWTCTETNARALSLTPWPLSQDVAECVGSSQSNPAPLRPDPLRVWARIAPSFGGIMVTTTLSLLSERIQDRAYLSIGVTSSSGAGPNGAPGGGDSRGIRLGLFRILDMNFREFVFHALRRIARAPRRVRSCDPHHARRQLALAWVEPRPSWPAFATERRAISTASPDTPVPSCPC